MSLIDAIKLIIGNEKEYETKLELLTAIGITSDNEETFKSCEYIRNELVEGSKEREDQGKGSLHSEDWERFGGDHWTVEADGLLERNESLSML